MSQSKGKLTTSQGGVSLLSATGLAATCLRNRLGSLHLHIHYLRPALDEGKHAGARERRRPAHKVADSVDRGLDGSVNERSSAPAIVDGWEPELRPHEGSLECRHLRGMSEFMSARAAARVRSALDRGSLTMQALPNGESTR